MKLLVCGGAGFIGSNLVRHILGSTDASVVVLDKLTYAGHLESLADVPRDGRFAFVEGDIAHRETVASVLRDHAPTAVFNLAAETHVDRSIDGPTPFVQTNVLGTVVLLEAARERGVRYVQVSTDEVYGSIETGSFTSSRRSSRPRPTARPRPEPTCWSPPTTTRTGSRR